MSITYKHSHLDEYGNVTKFKKHSSSWRPLVDALELLNVELKWVIPVVKNVRRLELENIDEDMNADVDVSQEIVEDLTSAIDTYTKGEW